MSVSNPCEILVPGSYEPTKFLLFCLNCKFAITKLKSVYTLYFTCAGGGVFAAGRAELNQRVMFWGRADFGAISNFAFRAYFELFFCFVTQIFGSHLRISDRFWVMAKAYIYASGHSKHGLKYQYRFSWISSAGQARPKPPPVLGFKTKPSQSPLFSANRSYSRKGQNICTCIK